MSFLFPLKQIAIAAAVTAVMATPALSQEVVKIGYSGPLSGGAALYGKNVQDGMNMAINEINAAGLTVAGKKVKLELVALDDKYNPSETAVNAQRMVQENKVTAILVPHSGGISALQNTNEAQKYIVLAYTSAPAATAKGNKLTMRIPPDFTAYLEPFSRYEMKKFGKNVAIAAGDHEYGKAWAAAFKPVWEAEGGKVVADNPMSYNRASDFYTGVSKAIAAKPDVMFVGGASEPTALVIKQARELGFKGGFLVIDQAKLDEIGKVTGGYAMAEGSVGVLPLIEDKTPAAVSFVERYHKGYPGHEPSSEVSLNYTAVWIWAKAMELAKTTTDATAIRAQFDAAVKTLTAANNPNVLTGVDAKSNTLADVRAAVIEGGKIKEVTLKSLSAMK